MSGLKIIYLNGREDDARYTDLTDNDVEIYNDAMAPRSYSNSGSMDNRFTAHQNLSTAQSTEIHDISSSNIPNIYSKKLDSQTHLMSEPKLKATSSSSLSFPDKLNDSTYPEKAYGNTPRYMPDADYISPDELGFTRPNTLSEQDEMLSAAFYNGHGADDNDGSNGTRLEEDDPTIPTLTFRTLLLGCIFAAGLAFCNQFYWFRTNPFRLTSFVAQILIYPFGILLARILPAKTFNTFGWRWSLNPGPFTIKEHALAVMLSTASSGVPLAIDIVVIRKMFYGMDLGWGTSLLLTLSSQLIGYSFAGIARRVLVYPKKMLWPGTFSQIALYKSLHDFSKHVEPSRRECDTKETLVSRGFQNFDNPYETINPDYKGFQHTTTIGGTGHSNEGIKEPGTAHANRMPFFKSIVHQYKESRRKSPRFWFFLMIFWISFIWYFVPNYLFKLLSVFSFMCLVAGPNNFSSAAIIAKQLGNGSRGLGMLSFTLDWNVISNAFLLSPITTPFWAATNIFSGFVIVMWIILPIAYYNNAWGSKSLPIYDYNLYTSDGKPYRATQIIDKVSKLRIDQEAYDKYGPPRMPFIYALQFGVAFAATTAILSHVALYHGKDVLDGVKSVFKRGDDSGLDSQADEHMRQMSRYKEVPHWWYLILFVITLAMGIVVGEVFDVIPWYALLLAIAISFVFIIPIGIITAMTNILPGLGVLSEVIVGYMLPGDPIANVTFKTYGYITTYQTVSLITDQKIGHYMKIPPRHTFLCQIGGTVIATIVQVAVSHWLMATNKDMCLQTEGNDWKCVQAAGFYSSSVIWGLVGPARMFGQGSPYGVLYYTFIIGFLLPLPFWYLSKKVFSRSKIAQRINIPVILSGVGAIPTSLPINYPMWYFWAFIFNYVLRKYRKGWWRRNVFTFSAAMDAGLAISGIVIYFALTSNATTASLSWWGNRSDFCQTSPPQPPSPPK